MSRDASPEEIKKANAVDVSSLRDPQTLAERTKEGKENWLITMGVCTHLGCVPLGAGEGENKGERKDEGGCEGKDEGGCKGKDEGGCEGEG